MTRASAPAERAHGDRIRQARRPAQEKARETEAREASRERPNTGGTSLPRDVRRFFWDCAFARLRWETDQDFVIGRLIERGDWRAMQWLRRKAGDAELRRWLEVRRGRGISPRRLRYWELVLDLPHRRVSAWIEAQRGLPWAGRLGS